MFVLWKATKLGSHFLFLPTSVGMTIFFLDYDLCQPDVHLAWGVTKKSSPGVVSHVGLHGGIGHRVAQDTSERHYPGVILNPSKVQWSKTQQGLIFLTILKFMKAKYQPPFYIILWYLMCLSHVIIPGSTAARSSHAVALNWTATPNRWTPGIGSGCRFGKCRRGPKGAHGKNPSSMWISPKIVIVCGFLVVENDGIWWNLREWSWNFEKIGESINPSNPRKGFTNQGWQKGVTRIGGGWPAHNLAEMLIAEFVQRCPKVIGMLTVFRNIHEYPMIAENDVIFRGLKTLSLLVQCSVPAYW